MTENDNNKKDEKTLEDELSGIKAEMAELKEMIKQKQQPTPEPPEPEAPEPPHSSFSFQFEDDEATGEFDNIGETFNMYMEGVMSGVAENLKRSMENMSRGFRNINVNIDKDIKDQAEKAKREAKRAARQIKRDIDHARRDAQQASRGMKHVVKYRPLNEAELEQFYEVAPNLTGALADTRRLMLLKELEDGPKYQGDLSDATGLKGGSFKHHLDSLQDLGYVYQEQARGRYLIKQLGMEALKLAETLFRRYNQTQTEQDLDMEIQEETVEEKEIREEIQTTSTETEDVEAQNDNSEEAEED